VLAGIVLGRLEKVNCATCFLPSSIVTGSIQGPVSETIENWMLLTVTAMSPSLLKKALFWTSPAPTVVLKETVIGCIANRPAAELAVPLSVTGVVDDDPAAALDVAMITSLESGPTAFGVKRAWNVNCALAARVKGRVGRLSFTSAKFALPETLKLLTVVATLAVQVMGSALEVPLTEVFAKLMGPVQLSGRLTGEPKAYRAPVAPM
jgi:hypothetical protein